MINGMKPGEPLLAEIAHQSTACTLQQFIKRVEAYMRKEEAIKTLGRVASPSCPPGRNWSEQESFLGKRKGATQDRMPNQKWTPVNANLSAIFEEAKKDPDFKPSPKMRTPPTKRTNQKYCEYRHDHGHWTEECLALKKEIDVSIRRGKLKKFVARHKDVGSYSWEKGKKNYRPLMLLSEKPWKSLKTSTLAKKFLTREVVISTKESDTPGKWASRKKKKKKKKKEDELDQNSYPLHLYSLVSKGPVIKS
jgi:hypothetical protein